MTAVRILLFGIGYWAVTVLPLSLMGVIPDTDTGMGVAMLIGIVCGFAGFVSAVWWESR